MSKKVLGRIIACALVLAMVLGLCTMASLADSSWGAEISSGKQDGVIGRTITIKVTGGSTAGTYTFNLVATGATLSATAVSVSNNNATYFTVTPTAAGSGSVTITPDTSSTADGAAKTITFNTRTPVLGLKNSTDTFSELGNDFTVTITDPADDGVLKVTPKGSGVVKSIIGNTVTVYGADTYEVDYTNAGGTSYVGSATKLINVSKQKTVFLISNDNVTLTDTDSVEIDYTTTCGDDVVASVSGTVSGLSATVDKTNKKIKISTTSVAPGSYSISVKDKGDGNYSESSAYGIVVNVVSSTATYIKLSPNYVTLDKDSSSQKVTVTVKNATLVDGIAYVNVKVSKPTGTAYRGVYIDGNRKSAGNTYRVSPSGNDATFSMTLKARYSGKYTITVSNGNSTVALPVVITGYNTLPQTGPDYSMVYIFAALLTVALGGIVLVNVLKKKDDYSK